MNRFGRTTSSLMYVVFLVAGLLTIVRFPAGPWSLPSLLAFSLLFLIVACSVWAHQSQWLAIDTEDVSINPEGPGIPRGLGVLPAHRGRAHPSGLQARVELQHGEVRPQRHRLLDGVQERQDLGSRDMLTLLTLGSRARR